MAITLAVQWAVIPVVRVPDMAFPVPVAVVAVPAAVAAVAVVAVVAVVVAVAVVVVAAVDQDKLINELNKTQTGSPN